MPLLFKAFPNLGIVITGKKLLLTNLIFNRIANAPRRAIYMYVYLNNNYFDIKGSFILSINATCNAKLFLQKQSVNLSFLTILPAVCPLSKLNKSVHPFLIRTYSNNKAWFQYNRKDRCDRNVLSGFHIR